MFCDLKGLCQSFRLAENWLLSSPLHAWRMLSPNQWLEDLACMKMFGSVISPHSFLELYHKTASELYTFLVEITNHSLGKLMLGSQCMVQGMQKLDGYGERFFSSLTFVVMSKWKLLLFISTMIFFILRLLQKTRK